MFDENRVIRPQTDLLDYIFQIYLLKRYFNPYN